MLDLKFIRANPELVKAASAKKHIPCDVDRILELDAEARGLGQQVDGLRARQKGVGKSLGQATAEERTLLLAGQKELKGGGAGCLRLCYARQQHTRQRGSRCEKSDPPDD